jgi:hypothetical protein
MAPTGDRLLLTPTQEAASRHLFSVAGWEAGNFLDKWTHRVASFFTGGDSDEARRRKVDEYIAMSGRIREVQGSYERAVADPAADAGALRELEDELVRLKDRRRSLRNDVEEALEAAISATLRDQRIGAVGALLWPPVDFRLESPPRVLITSPRDRIERLESVLLDMSVTALDSEEIEARILEQQNLAAIVLGLGGLATYPTFVNDDSDLLRILDLAAHEWLHAYLFFHPLGQGFNSSAVMQTLNETISNVVGKELGRLAFTAITGEPAPEEPEPPTEPDPDAFDFDSYMRETRRTTDELLAAGEIEEAEAYMEARRVELQEHGFFVRKINQAYFAFQGTYADTPFSVSPIGPEVEELRSLVADVGELIRAVRGVSNYDEFQEVLEKRRQAVSGASSWERLGTAEAESARLADGRR